MQEVLRTAEHVAARSSKILITGESGVGKDVLARFIHARSERASRPFVAINCAGLSDTLLETELFGHVRGSFTGAHRDKVGKLQLAHRGTIFLDEVGEMSPRMQVLLLRFLENGEIHPVGSDTLTTRVDVRVIAATNRDLRERVQGGAFREDLLYRLNVVNIHIPPLRDRPEDIAALIEHLLAAHSPPPPISAAAMEVLMRYPWPGNVRELQNVVEQLTFVERDGPISVDDLPASLLQAVTGHVRRSHDRRQTVSSDLFEGLVTGRIEFWTHVYPAFIDRDLTRDDLRQLIRRGLSETEGNYRALLRLFRMPPADYKRLMNLLSTHECVVDFREFRPTFKKTANGD